jgi:hypothetical protein
VLSEREEIGHGEGVGVYATLLQSDTVQPHMEKSNLQKAPLTGAWTKKRFFFLQILSK